MKDWAEESPASKSELPHQGVQTQNWANKEDAWVEKVGSDHEKKQMEPVEEQKEVEQIGSANPLTGSKPTETPRWSKREDKLLTTAVKKYKELGFTRISQEIEGKSK